MTKITKRVVDATQPKPSGMRSIVWDDEVKGFGLLVLPSGVKSYFYRYRTAEGRERRITIGKHGACTPDEARNDAEEYRRQVKKGKDPLSERVALRNAATISDLFDAYLSSEKFKTKASSTRANDRGCVERHLRPLLGRRQAHALTPADIEKAFSDICEGKTARTEKTKPRGLARVKGGEGAARRAIAVLSSLFSWAVRERLVATNPCVGVRTGVSGVRETILESAEDYRKLFLVLQNLENEKKIRTPAADAIRIIALTGARRGEIATLRWAHVDLKRGLITLPSTQHKTGRKTGKPRIIGLPTAAQIIIARQKTQNGKDFVFTPAGGEGPISLSKPWRKVRARAEFPKELGLHGLRHSLASHMAMNGAEAAEIMTALGHRQLSTAQRYVHWAQDGRQSLSEKAAAVALAGLQSSTEQEGGVLPMKVRK